MIIQFQSAEEKRQRYVFKNKPVQILGEDGEYRMFPCIVFWNAELDIPVAYPGLERWIFKLAEAELQSYQTLKKKAYHVCSFLNYILWNTNRNCIHEIELNDIREWVRSFRDTADGDSRDPDSWNRGIADVFTFLVYYMESNRHIPFRFQSMDLMDIKIVKDPATRRKNVIRTYNKFSVKPPKRQNSKNRLLLQGYLEMILWECKKHDPMITLAVALQAYAGLREGEIVNLTRDSISMIYAGFGRIGKIILNLQDEAEFAKLYSKKIAFGSIKVYRKQEVYPDFIQEVIRLYDTHCDILETYRADKEKSAPLFINSHGKPLSVAAYSARVKKVFKEHFLPDLKVICEREGSWAIHAPYVETYERGYPGAHMFRHWFTMYLLKEHVSSDEISKWRGDTNRDSMLDYIHINANMIEAYQTSVYKFQKALLEEIL